MKKLLYVFLLTILSVSAMAGQGGPDVYGYIWKDSFQPGGPTYSWIDVPTKPGAFQVKNLADDNTRGSFNIGFPFHYYWYDVNTFWVGSNGYIAFNNAQLSSPFGVIPSMALPNDFISVFNADLNFDGLNNPAACWYWKNLAADTMVISWINVPFWDANAGANNQVGSNTFQVILSAVDSSITFQYNTQQGQNAQGFNFLAIGIENNSGNIGLQHSHDIYPPLNYAVKYYYPSFTNYQVTDASVSYCDNTENGGRFISKDGNNFKMTSLIKNTGNQACVPFNVNSTIKNSLNATQVQDNQMTGGLSPGQTQAMSMTNQFAPITAGTYSYTTTTQLAGDATMSNNARTMELVVVDTIQPYINLSFTDLTSEGAGLSWQGGDGGAAVYFIPPYTPCKIDSLYFFIMGNPTNANFHAKIFQDSLVNQPGALLFDTLILAQDILTNSWNAIGINDSIGVSSGGFYVAWVMDGDGIQLGQDISNPISFRSLELLGNAWSTYRSAQTEDLMINATLKRGPLNNQSISEKTNKVALAVYPNPSNGMLTLEFDNSLSNSKVTCEIIGIDGKIVNTYSWGNVTTGKAIRSIDVSDVANGIYSVRFTANNSVEYKKITILK